MAASGGTPASYLANGYSWMDPSVRFTVPDGDSAMASACQAVWELSAALRASRGERGLSMSDLAFKAGVRRQTISDIENGHSWPDVATMGRLFGQLHRSITAVRAPTD